MRSTRDRQLQLPREASPDGLDLHPASLPGFYWNGDMAADAGGTCCGHGQSYVWKVAPDGSGRVVAGNGGYGGSIRRRPNSPTPNESPTALTVNATGDSLHCRQPRPRHPESDAGWDHSGCRFHPGCFRRRGSGDGRPAIRARDFELAFPGPDRAQSGLAVDSAGNLYIAGKFSHHRIRKVSIPRMITTVAGNRSAPLFRSVECLPLGDGGPLPSRPR